MTNLDLTQFDGHTPGPWVFHPPNKYNDISISVPLENSSMTLRTAEAYLNEWDEVNIPELISNFKLMTAAPELLAELKEARQEIERLKALLSRVVEVSDKMEFPMPAYLIGNIKLEITNHA